MVNLPNRMIITDLVKFGNKIYFYRNQIKKINIA